MLYALEQNPAVKLEVVDALRRRGIGFALTDGVRGLTRSKGRNDEELKRALEEAERRRRDPEIFVMPNTKDAAALLDKSRHETLAAAAEMPDFVVRQQIQRSYAYAGTGNYTENDRLVVAVSYSEAEGQKNKILTVNGVLQDNSRSDLWPGVGGYTSIGEFVGFLSGVFKTESETRFSLLTTDLVRGRRSIVWQYEIDAAKATYRIQSGLTQRVVSAGYKGKIWIDRENARVLRLEMEAIQIPSDYPVKSVHRIIEYDWVRIPGENTYLLPISADVRLVSQEPKILVESRNRSQFRNYQKYGTDVIAVDDDTEPIVDEKPNP